MIRRWVILNGVLAIIVLGLGVQIAVTWARALPPVEARTPAKVSEAAPRTGEGGKRGGKRGQADKAPQTPAMLVTAIVNKDLFDPSRSRPSEESRPAVVAVEVTPPPGISLVGVRLFGRDREGFILDATQGNQQRRIRLGDTVGNFTVKTIRSSSVVLAAATGEYVTLTLTVDKTKGGAAPVPARPGRAQATPAAGAPASPAAGVSAGASPAAGVGGAAKPPAVAAGAAPGAPPGAPAQPAPVAPPTPPQAATPPKPKGPPISPNLPEGVRQKLEQMRQNRK
jgi:hypothetical protein